VGAVAERFDRFDSTGVPLRSWLRMRFLRVADTAAESQAEYESMLAEARAAQAQAALAATAPGTGPEPTATVIAVGQGAGDAEGENAPPVRFDLLAFDGLGSPFLWRLLATYNDLEDPLHVEPGTVLTVPPGVSTGAAASSPPNAGISEVGP
jgi:hypothetical protein